MMILELRRSELELRRACDPGLDLFDDALALQNLRRQRGDTIIGDDGIPRYFGPDLPPIDILRVELTIDVIVGCACFLGTIDENGHEAMMWPWLVEQRLAPIANLYGADLRSADLYGAYLRGANLRSADLRGADLGSAYLGSADLSGANLRGANLIGADLRSANLRGANLGSADLSGADLRGASLSGANLRDAYLSSADLRDANLRDANLRDANLGGANLRGANLVGARNWPSGIAMPDGFKICSQGCCVVRSESKQ